MGNLIKGLESGILNNINQQGYYPDIDDLEKAVPIGSISQRRDGAYKKVGEGKWIPVKKSGSKKKEESAAKDQRLEKVPATSKKEGSDSIKLDYSAFSDSALASEFESQTDLDSQEYTSDQMIDILEAKEKSSSPASKKDNKSSDSYSSTVKKQAEKRAEKEGRVVVRYEGRYHVVSKEQASKLGGQKLEKKDKGSKSRADFDRVISQVGKALSKHKTDPSKYSPDAVSALRMTAKKRGAELGMSNEKIDEAIATSKTAWEKESSSKEKDAKQKKDIDIKTIKDKFHIIGFSKYKSGPKSGIDEIISLKTPSEMQKFVATQLNIDKKRVIVGEPSKGVYRGKPYNRFDIRVDSKEFTLKESTETPLWQGHVSRSQYIQIDGDVSDRKNASWNKKRDSQKKVPVTKKLAEKKSIKSTKSGLKLNDLPNKVGGFKVVEGRDGEKWYEARGDEYIDEYGDKWPDKSTQNAGNKLAEKFRADGFDAQMVTQEKGYVNVIVKEKKIKKSIDSDEIAKAYETLGL